MSILWSSSFSSGKDDYQFSPASTLFNVLPWGKSSFRTSRPTTGATTKSIHPSRPSRYVLLFPYGHADFIDISLSVAKDFHQNIRHYNNAFSLTSLGAQIDRSVLGQMGVYTFRIHGELCHLIGSLIPPAHDIPKFSQIYLYDSSNEQVELRMSHFCKYDVVLNDLLLRALQNMFHDQNPYAIQLKHARERIHHNPNAPIHLKISTVEAPSSDHRRYNRPTANEVAAILPGAEDTTETGPRDLIIEYRTGRLRRISELHSAYLPLRYPILLPYGEQGWHPNLFSIAEYVIPKLSTFEYC